MTWRNVLILVSLLGATSTAQAWGERGHHEVCATATRLVQNAQLKRYLRGRLHMMGHLCNIPDTSWRSLPGAKGGDQSHFMNFENLDLTPDTMPLDWNELVQLKKGTVAGKNKKVVHDVGATLGSSWFRYQQFHGLAAEAGRKGDTSLMISHMGVMGHFVGDAAQPLHNTTDFDGWESGHGGLHSYYESQVVSELPLDLSEQIYQRAVAIRTERLASASAGGVFGGNSMERIRNVTKAALSEKSRILEVDVVLAPSKQERDARGVSKRVEAKRRSPQETAKDFQPLIVNQMAWAAAALAETWDQIYVEAGEPRLKADFNYPFRPEYVAPEYADRQPSSAVKKKSSKKD